MNCSTKPFTKVETSWRSPSNIALVKYWGKLPGQIPMNASLSMTLRNCYTETSVKVTEGNGLTFFIDEQVKTGFDNKVGKLITTFKNLYLNGEDFHFNVKTTNSFPHSSGIASSASSMSALAICLMDLIGKTHELNQVSSLARLGSGSASRSVIPGYSLWGNYQGLGIEGSDQHAIDVNEIIHPSFKTLRNSILIVSADEKEVSSTEGHRLMKDHLFRDIRIDQAKNNLDCLLKALKTGEQDPFISIVEQEALSLHAMMMTSRPSYLLMKPNSLSIIEKIKKFRKETGLFLCFTLDAGPNIHLLYSESDSNIIEKFLNSEVAHLLVNNQIITDEIGLGPVKLDELSKL